MGHAEFKTVFEEGDLVQNIGDTYEIMDTHWGTLNFHLPIGEL